MSEIVTIPRGTNYAVILNSKSINGKKCIKSICLNEVPENLVEVKLDLGGSTITTFNALEANKNLLDDLFVHENESNILPMALYHNTTLIFVFDDKSSANNDYEFVTTRKHEYVHSKNKCEIYDETTGNYHEGNIVVEHVIESTDKRFFTPSISIETVPKIKDVYEILFRQQPPITSDGLNILKVSKFYAPVLSR
jgi:hypothetical protein